MIIIQTITIKNNKKQNINALINYLNNGWAIKKIEKKKSTTVYVLEKDVTELIPN